MLNSIGRRRGGCNCNMMVVGSIPARGNELLFINILISSLSYATQHAMPRKIWRKMGNRVF